MKSLRQQLDLLSSPELSELVSIVFVILFFAFRQLPLFWWWWWPHWTNLAISAIQVKTTCLNSLRYLSLSVFFEPKVPSIFFGRRELTDLPGLASSPKHISTVAPYHAVDNYSLHWTVLLTFWPAFSPKTKNKPIQHQSKTNTGNSLPNLYTFATE